MGSCWCGRHGLCFGAPRVDPPIHGKSGEAEAIGQLRIRGGRVTGQYGASAKRLFAALQASNLESGLIFAARTMVLFFFPFLGFPFKNPPFLDSQKKEKRENDDGVARVKVPPAPSPTADATSGPARSACCAAARTCRCSQRFVRRGIWGDLVGGGVTMGGFDRCQYFDSFWGLSKSENGVFLFNPPLNGG